MVNTVLNDSAFMYFIEGTTECQLEEILIFFSGAEKVPLLGFMKDAALVFLGCDEKLPTASTCSIILRIPTCHSTYEEFAECMFLALKGNDGFGGV